MNLYVASSWRNQRQPDIVRALRRARHEVYDFRNPAPEGHGFHWSEIDPHWQSWSPKQFQAALQHPLARAGFAGDMTALQRCDACVLVLPCGRSAHLELGWAVGAGKRTAILLEEGHSTCEPELMVSMVDHIALSFDELIDWLQRHEDGGRDAA